MRLNFGCGENKLPDWVNYDADIDIEKPLPCGDESADFILCENRIQLIPQYLAIEFFRECYRVLKPKGVARIIVPSIERIKMSSNVEYFKFTERWQDKGATRRGAMHAITYAHCHKAIWTESLLSAALFMVGFSPERSVPSISRHRDLCGIDGNAKIIGEQFNEIESCIYEATK